MSAEDDESRMHESRSEIQKFREIKMQIFCNIYDAYFQRVLSEKELANLINDMKSMRSREELLEYERNLAAHSGFSFVQQGNSVEETKAVEEMRGQVEQVLSTFGQNTYEQILTNVMDYLRTNNHSGTNFLYTARSSLAFALNEMWLEHKKLGGSAKALEERVMGLFRTKDFVPEFLEKSLGILLGKRQPGLTEAVEATFERLRALEDLTSVLGETVEGIVVGGSMAYGPFYNIRKDRGDQSGSSDFDLLIPVKASEFFRFHGEKLENTSLFESESLERFLKRKALFKNMLEAGSADILSQKIRVSRSDFNISMHFFPEEIFKDTFGMPFGEALSRREDVIRTLKDYRSEPFNAPVCLLQNLDGTAYTYPIPNQKKIEEGVLSDMPSYIIDHGQFIPGLYQGLVYLFSSVVYDKTGSVDRQIRDFQRRISEQLEQERLRSPGKQLHFAHVRNRIFPSQLLNAADSK